MYSLKPYFESFHPLLIRDYHNLLSVEHRLDGLVFPEPGPAIKEGQNAHKIIVPIIPKLADV